MALATAAGEARFEQLVDLETRIASVMGVLNASSAEAAARLGIAEGRYLHPLGERADWHWLSWS